MDRDDDRESLLSLSDLAVCLFVVLFDQTRISDHRTIACESFASFPPIEEKSKIYACFADESKHANICDNMLQAAMHEQRVKRIGCHHVCSISLFNLSPSIAGR